MLWNVETLNTSLHNDIICCKLKMCGLMWVVLVNFNGIDWYVLQDLIMWEIKGVALRDTYLLFRQINYSSCQPSWFRAGGKSIYCIICCDFAGGV